MYVTPRAMTGHKLAIVTDWGDVLTSKEHAKVAGGRALLANIRTLAQP